MSCSDTTGGDVTQRGELARQQLISAALVLFAENGIEGASTRQIAALAGQNIGAIAYYFGSKEGLYHAVARWIAELIQSRFELLFSRAQAFLASPNVDDDTQGCMDCIKDIIRLQCEVLTEPGTINLSKILFREQLAPTAAFQLIHERALAPLHSTLTGLIASYIGIPANSTRAILHAHAIIGEVLSFRAGRETMLMRVKWHELGNAETAEIESVLFEHIELILNGLRAKQVNSMNRLDQGRL